MTTEALGDTLTLGRPATPGWTWAEVDDTHVLIGPDGRATVYPNLMSLCWGAGNCGINPSEAQ